VLIRNDIPLYSSCYAIRSILIYYLYISTIFEASLLIIDYPNFSLPLLEARSFAFFGLQLDIIETKNCLYL
jgi:hypothetical protein